MSAPRPDHRRRHPPSGLPRRLDGAALGLLGLLGLLCPAHEGRTEADSAAPREVPLVTAIPAMRESVLFGFTRPVAELPLVAETEGRVVIPARIHRVNPGLDATTRKIAIDLALAELIEPARGGLRVRLRLHQPEATGALSVPASAVGSSDEESWVSRPDGTRLTVVRLGPDPRDPRRVRVTSPRLAPGDPIRALAEP